MRTTCPHEDSQATCLMLIYAKMFSSIECGFRSIVYRGHFILIKSPSRKGRCHWWTSVDIHDVKTQHFKEMLYKPIILAMEICELWWPNLDMVVHEISLPKWLDYTGPLMKHCVLTSWKSMVVHERPLVAMEDRGRFRLGWTAGHIWNTRQVQK